MGILGVGSSSWLRVDHEDGKVALKVLTGDGVVVVDALLTPNYAEWVADMFRDEATAARRSSPAAADLDLIRGLRHAAPLVVDLNGVPDEALTAQLRRQAIQHAPPDEPVYPPFHAYEADLREAGIL